MYRFRRKLITIFALTFFLLSALFVAIPLALFYTMVWSHNEERRMQYHRFICSYFKWIATHIPDCKVLVNNVSGEDFSKPSIIISNHQSHLDLLVTLMLSPKIVAMTNRWVWNFPVYAPVIRYLEFYPVTHGLEVNEIKLKSLIDRGYSILIYPEGTRSAENKILRFHQGAFYLAEKFGLDIVPIYLDGPGRVLPKKDFTMYPGTITVNIGERSKFDANQDNFKQKTKLWHQHYIKWESEF